MSDANRDRIPARFAADDDDVEIVEVVGLDERLPEAAGDDDEDEHDVLLSLDDDDFDDPDCDERAVAALEPLTLDELPDDDDDDGILTLDGDEDPETERALAAAMAEHQTPAPSADRAAPPPPRGAPTLTDRERLIRLQADFENYKKRTERERRRHEREANAALIKRMLPMLDNFERALDTDGAAGENGLRDGVVLIFRQVLEELRREGLKAIEAVGRRFDPNVHEAVETDAASDLPPHTVVEELQRGYTLSGRLLRPALVKVAIDPSDQRPANPAGEES